MSTQNQAVMAEFAKMQQRILPAKLADSDTNGILIRNYFTKRSLAPTAETFYQAVNELVEKLEWTVPPKKLTAQRANTAPAAVDNPLKLEADRAAKAKAVEAADAATKASAAGYKAARGAVEGYLPMNRRGTVDFREQADTTKLLNVYIAKEEARGVSGEAVLQKVAEFIQGRYEQQEKSRERV